MTESTDPTAPSGDVAPEGTPATDGRPAAPADEQVTELLNRYTRLAADFDNFRKRTAREQAERLRYAAEPAVRALLPVLDNLRRAVDHAPGDADGGLLEGLHFTVRQFEEALASVGVTPIEAVGQPFDPAQHEAAMGEESDSVEVDTVVEELQRGYRLGDRVVRPSVVKVAHPRHVAVRGGSAAASPGRQEANGAVHHDLPASPPAGTAGGEDWVEA